MKKNSEKRSVSNKIRGIKRKLMFTVLKGGKCSECDYYKNLSALQFHHREASKKEFPLTQRNLSGKPIKKLLKEIDKCDLLCANCHSEHHNPTQEINQVKKTLSDYEKN